ncbi:hypothetical protein X739_16095 [Mesorhizobium sp. LNHC220B00]|nr:hypothetical protein [Mesorhizobium sp. LNHC220B00]ESY85801.1 hypothetical protein X739_16095 [Mesorhizobium sp. LNHC220B00]
MRNLESKVKSIKLRISQKKECTWEDVAHGRKWSLATPLRVEVGCLIEREEVAVYHSSLSEVADLPEAIQ